MSTLTDSFDYSVVRGKSILVLSDAYPPYAAGGAELSLRTSIASLPLSLRRQIVILSFSGPTNGIEVSTDNECLVIHTPPAMGWPYETMFEPDFHKAKAFGGLGERNYARFIRLRKSLGSKTAPLSRLAYKESLFGPRGGILTDHFIDASDARVGFVASVCYSMDRVQRLIADNTRSILIASSMPEFKSRVSTSVAIVRDNRFHCARPSQNRSVRGRPCGRCEFDCASEDAPMPPGAPALRKRTLQLTDQFRKSALRSFDSVIVTSHELKRHIQRIVSPDQELYRIPNSVGHTSEIEANNIAVAREEKPTLLMIGMLNENKGQLAFLQAATSWLQENPDVNLVFAGRGDRIAQLIREHIQRHRLTHQVTLLDYVPRQQLFHEITKATLVIAPTVWPEPFGRVPLEAAACRRAIVAFAVGGLNESIVDGKTGILVEPSNYDMFLESVDTLLNDASLRSKIEQQAFEWITTEYAPERSTGKFAHLAFGR